METQTWKYAADLYIRCHLHPPNCGKTNVLLENPYGLCFENVYVLEVVATTKISIFEEFIGTD